jgi:hypothetical protein
MADVRYFQVQSDTSIPRAFRAVRDNSGTVYDYETEGVAYHAGQVVSSDNIDPRVLERYDDGDEHLNSLLKEVDSSAADEYTAQVRADNELLRAPEHTVEAYVLASDPDEPYTLLSTKQAGEAAAEGLDEVAERSKQQLEEAGGVVEPVAPEDELSAIDFAAVKGDADKEAGKGQNVTDLAQDGVFTDAEVDAPVEPEPAPEPEPAQPKTRAKKSESEDAKSDKE